VPLARYFFFVGSVLLAVLFVAEQYLPDSPQTFVREARMDKSIIRIKSAHKWPEPIVLDTSLPTIAPPPSLVVANAPVVNNQPREATNSPRAALAQLDAPPRRVVKTSSPDRAKRKVAKRVVRTNTRVAAFGAPVEVWPPSW
jgi:hypothetical protein